MSEYVWGIDPAISHVSFAYADLSSDEVGVESLITRTEEREGARLGLLDRQIRLYSKQLARRYPPACVLVEQPSGRFPKPQLAYAVGAISAALYETLAVPVWFVTSGHWKKSVLGYGNASKDQVAEHVRGLRLDFDSQDDADAICVALCGRAIFQSRQWDVAA